MLGRCKTTFFKTLRSHDYIVLNENDLFIRNNYKIANIFNTFIFNTVPNLGIKIDQ